MWSCVSVRYNVCCCLFVLSICDCVKCFNCVSLPVIDCVMVCGVYIISTMLGVIVCVCFMCVCALYDVWCAVVRVVVCVFCVLVFE